MGFDFLGRDKTCDALSDASHVLVGTVLLGGDHHKSDELNHRFLRNTPSAL